MELGGQERQVALDLGSISGLVPSIQEVLLGNREGDHRGECSGEEEGNTEDFQSSTNYSCPGGFTPAGLSLVGSPEGIVQPPSPLVEVWEEVEGEDNSESSEGLEGEHAKHEQEGLESGQNLQPKRKKNKKSSSRGKKSRCNF